MSFLPNRDRNRVAPGKYLRAVFERKSYFRTWIRSRAGAEYMGRGEVATFLYRIKSGG